MRAIIEYLNQGGWMMYVILLVSIFGTILFLERAFNLFVLRKLDMNGFMSSVLGHVEARRFRQALNECEVKSKHPLVDVIRAGIMRGNRREKEVERAMEKEVLGAMHHITKRVALLGLLANTSTLLGLLGTIFGLIAAFASVAVATAAERQTALADGISMAMYTTAFGIVVAVPLLFMHHFLTERSDKILMEIEDGATRLMVSLSGVVREGSGAGDKAA